MRVVCIVHEILDCSGPINALSPIILALRHAPNSSLSVISLTYSPTSSVFREFCGDSVDILVPRSKAFQRFCWPFKVLLHLFNTKPDVIHSHLVFPNAFVLCARLIGLPSRIVCTIHNKEDYMRKNIPFSPLGLAALIEKRLAFKADVILAVSDSLAEYLRTNYFSQHASKVVSIPNGIDTGKYISSARDRKAIRSLFNITDSEIVIGGVGRLIERKNYAFLLRAFHLLAGISPYPVRLLILGEGPQLERLLQLVHSLNLSKLVKFVGHSLSSEQFYPAFDIFVHPSTAEGFGLSIIEAMSSSLPCIAFDIEGVRDLVTHGKTGYLLPTPSCELWADTMASLIADAGLVRQMGLNARIVALSAYDFTCISKKYLAFYSSLLLGSCSTG